jgi:hypothetical protein
MTPPRLCEGGTEFERGVLASASLDTGGKDGLKRTLVALGIGAGTISAGAGTAAAGVATGGAAAGAGASAAGAGASVVGWGVVAKWVGVAIVVAAGGGATLSAVSVAHVPPPAGPTVPAATRPRATDERQATPRAPAQTVVPERVPSRPDPIRSAPVPVVIAPATPRLPVGAPATPAAPDDSATRNAAPGPREASLAARGSIPAPTPFSSSLPPRSGSSLEAELLMLDRVRASLAMHDATAALAQLDTHARTFPALVLADEAIVLRVDALVAKGDLTGAEVLGRRFLAAHPASPHAPHLLRVLEATHNP